MLCTGSGLAKEIMNNHRLEEAVPKIGFGTYLISNDQAETTVSSALKVGYRHIDTAEAYQNEQGIGAALASAKRSYGLNRKDLFITTKLWPGNPRWGMPTKNYAATIKSLDQSLKKLGISYVDLYLIHAPFGSQHRLDQWRACCDLKKSGKTRFIGVANFNQTHIGEIEDAGLPLPDANQIELHPWCQKGELVSFLQHRKITQIAYSSLIPLANWREKTGQASAKTEAMRNDGASLDSPFKSLAGKYRVSEAQLLLKWGLQKGFAVLPKTTDENRMRENFSLSHFNIDTVDMEVLATLDRGGGVAWESGDPCDTP